MGLFLALAGSICVEFLAPSAVGLTRCIVLFGPRMDDLRWVKLFLGILSTKRRAIYELCSVLVTHMLQLVFGQLWSHWRAGAITSLGYSATATKHVNLGKDCTA